MFQIGRLDVVSEEEKAQAQQSASKLHEGMAWHQAWDDVTRRELNPDMVRVGRKEEIE